MNLKYQFDRAVAWFAVIAASLVLFSTWAVAVLADDNPIEGEINAGNHASALESWQLIVAFVLPLLIAVVVKATYSPAIKSLIMIAVSAIVTAATMYLQGDLDSGTDYVESVMKVAALTIAYYQGIWKPTEVAPKIQNTVNA